jgi:hypothetical protein
MVCCHDVASVCTGAWHALKPTYPDRMILLILWNLANWALSIYGVGNIVIIIIALF